MAGAVDAGGPDHLSVHLLKRRRPDERRSAVWVGTADCVSTGLRGQGQGGKVARAGDAEGPSLPVLK